MTHMELSIDLVNALRQFNNTHLQSIEKDEDFDTIINYLTRFKKIINSQLEQDLENFNITNLQFERQEGYSIDKS